MNLDVIAEIIATSFNAARPALRRYSCSVILHSPDKAATQRRTGYGEGADSARINAIHKALQSWGGMDTATEEVRVSSRILPDGYGAPYLTDADKCMALASRMPAESQAYKDAMMTAEWYEQQYIAVRYDYLRDR